MKSKANLKSAWHCFEITVLDTGHTTLIWPFGLLVTAGFITSFKLFLVSVIVMDSVMTRFSENAIGLKSAFCCV